MADNNEPTMPSQAQSQRLKLTPDEQAPATRARQCDHIKDDQSRCSANALHGSDYCFFHDPSMTAERDAARKKGGEERSRKAAVLSSETPDKQLSCAADVTALLAETINQVRRGEIDPKVSNAVGYLAAILLRARERADLEQRLARLESIVAKPPADPTTEVKLHQYFDGYEFVEADKGGKA